MKQIRLSKENDAAVAKLVKDAKLDLLTFPRVANMAIKKGLPVVRKLFIPRQKA